MKSRPPPICDRVALLWNSFVDITVQVYSIMKKFGYSESLHDNALMQGRGLMLHSVGRSSLLTEEALLSDLGHHL